MTPSYSPRRAGSTDLLFDLERSISKSDQVRSGQGQVMIQVGEHAYLPKPLDEPSPLAPFAHLYFHPVATIGEKRIVTSCEVR